MALPSLLFLPLLLLIQSGSVITIFPGTSTGTSYPCINMVFDWRYSSSNLPANTPMAVYCYSGKQATVLAHFMMVRFHLDTTAHDGQFTMYTGDNCSAVGAQYDAATARYFSLAPWREVRRIRLAPFERHCVGVATSKPYSVHLLIRWMDYGLLIGTVCGAVLFLLADRLSRAPTFHYSSGMAVGMVGGVLIAVYLLSRLMPRRGGGAYVLLVTGWSLSVYLIQYMFDSAIVYAHAYRHWILGYLIVCGVISLSVCYRYGPVTDSRTRALLRCSLQLIGLALVYACGNFVELAGALVLLLVACRLLPWALGGNTVVRRVTSSLRWRWLPPKPRPLLTMQQYEAEASEATRRALEELREYCRSSECDTWRTVSRLSTPMKFASFVAGDSHLSDDEIIRYDLEQSRLMAEQSFDDDEEDDDKDEGGIGDEFMSSDED